MNQINFEYQELFRAGTLLLFLYAQNNQIEDIVYSHMKV